MDICLCEKMTTCGRKGWCGTHDVIPFHCQALLQLTIGLMIPL